MYMYDSEPVSWKGTFLGFRLLGNISEFLKFEIVNQFLHIGKIQLLSKGGLFNFFGRLEIKSLM